MKTVTDLGIDVGSVVVLKKHVDRRLLYHKERELGHPVEVVRLAGEHNFIAKSFHSYNIEWTWRTIDVDYVISDCNIKDDFDMQDIEEFLCNCI